MKYWFVYSIYLQEGLAQRASFIMDRFRAIVVLISFYYFWTAILNEQDSVAGYSRSAMLTYVLGMNIVRSLVFASRTWEIAGEINQGRLSGYLLKPVNYMIYTFFRDLSEKTINSISAVIEIVGLILIFGIAFVPPPTVWHFVAFLVSIAGAILLYFLISFMVGCAGFWTAESGGPRWLLELFLEFSAGAFFPIDVLPPAVQTIFQFLPSPYLLFYPLQIFMGRIDSHQIMNVFFMQAFWIVVIGLLARWVWSRGVRMYGAEGA